MYVVSQVTALMHASTTMKCTGATIANDTSTCTSNEDGNPMTVTGGGCRHLMSVEKWVKA